MPILFEEISIQQNARNNFLWLFVEFPTDDFHLILGKFNKRHGTQLAPVLYPPAPTTIIYIQLILHNIYRSTGTRAPATPPPRSP